MPRARGRLVTVAVALVTALASAAPGVAAEQPPPDASGEATVPDPEQVAALERAVDEAETALVDARGAEAEAAAARDAAEAERRRVEQRLGEAVFEVRVLADRVAALATALEAARRTTTLITDQLADEVALLEDRAAEAYKYGSAHRTLMAWQVVSGSRDVNDVVQGIKDLSSIAGHQQAIAEEVRVALANAIQAERELVQRRNAAGVLLARAQAHRHQLEDAATAARQASYDAERAWLDAADTTGLAMARRDRARKALDALTATSSAASPDPGTGPSDPGTEQPSGASAGGDSDAAGDEGDVAGDAEATPPPEPGPTEWAPTPQVPGGGAEDHVHAEDPVGDEAPTLTSADPRAAGLAKRRAALDRALSIPLDARRSRDDLTCPVAGSTFTNDWHYDRSGLRRHEGTDIFAPAGTPIVAVADATIDRLDPVDTYGTGGGDLGGISLRYVEADGTRWYAAHLQAIADGLEVGATVTAGQLVGWVGTTGNARSTPPHLHLGQYVGGVAVNAYPSLVAACGPSSPTGG